MMNACNMHFLAFMCATFLFGKSYGHGSTLNFQSSSNEIHANLTHTLRMRCGLNDTSSTVSGAIVGRSVSQADVSFLTSLVIMRDGQEVASVSEHTPASALLDLDNINVEGQLTPNSVEMGYIQLIWDYPTGVQAGEYSCEANALSKKGHNVIFSKSFEVEVTDPSTSDLITQIRFQDNEIHDLKVKVNELISEHVESGFINCGGSSSWTDHDTNGVTDGLFDGATHRYRQVTQKFKRAYNKAPVVHLGMRDMYAAEAYNTYFQIKVDSVDEQSFTMSCRTGNDDRIYQLAVNWISTSA